jgi:hypothetical protein
MGCCAPPARPRLCIRSSRLQSDRPPLSHMSNAGVGSGVLRQCGRAGSMRCKGGPNLLDSVPVVQAEDWLPASCPVLGSNSCHRAAQAIIGRKLDPRRLQSSDDGRKGGGCRDRKSRTLMQRQPRRAGAGGHDRAIAAKVGQAVGARFGSLSRLPGRPVVRIARDPQRLLVATKDEKVFNAKHRHLCLGVEEG